LNIFIATLLFWFGQKTTVFPWRYKRETEVDSLNEAELRPVEVYAIEIDQQLDTALFNALLSYVTPEKKERIKRFYHYADALRSLLGDLLIRHLICQKLNLNNQQLQFYQTEYGKPFLRNDRNFHYNISHSGDWVVCAWATAAVGIDIEQVALVDPSLAQRILTPAEYQIFSNINCSEQRHYFYSLWTLKESFVKAVGKGLSIPPDSFAIQKEQEEFLTVYPEPDSCRYFLKQYDWGESYCLAVCAATNLFGDTVKIITLAECQNGLAATASA
jgi:4'-phosphopantetheinyl transferase